MLENVGKTDRWVRTAVGSSLVLLGAWHSRRGGLASALALGAGAMLLESAVTRVCPVNSWLGVDTRGQEEKSLGDSSLRESATEPSLEPPLAASDGEAAPI